MRSFANFIISSRYGKPLLVSNNFKFWVFTQQILIPMLWVINGGTFMELAYISLLHFNFAYLSSSIIISYPCISIKVKNVTFILSLANAQDNFFKDLELKIVLLLVLYLSLSLPLEHRSLIELSLWYTIINISKYAHVFGNVIIEFGTQISTFTCVFNEISYSIKNCIIHNHILWRNCFMLVFFVTILYVSKFVVVLMLSFLVILKISFLVTSHFVNVTWRIFVFIGFWEAFRIIIVSIFFLFLYFVSFILRLWFNLWFKNI